MVTAVETRLLLRYGAIPEVVRGVCAGAECPPRGTAVVVETRRGLELADVLGAAPAAGDDGERPLVTVVRPATESDLRHAAALRQSAQSEFSAWSQRLADWKLALELLDLEWTLDRRTLILYVLSGRDTATTELPLHAAGIGYDSIAVEPVSNSGLAPAKAKKGCGDCGCH